MDKDEALKMDEEYGHQQFGAKLAAAVSLGDPKKNPHPHGNAYALVPDGYTLEYIDKPTEPPRRTGTVLLDDVASFLEYWKRQADDASYVYGSVKKSKFVAVLNEHSKDANWRDHRASLQLNFSPEHGVWFGHNGHQHPFAGNEDFAIFIEENVPDVVAPPAVDLLEMALNFKVKKIESFGNAVRLADGNTRLDYTSDVSSGAGKTGDMVVPETIKIAIPIYEGIGEPRYEFDARFRYRLNNGKLTIWYELVRPLRVLNLAFQELVERIEAADKGIGKSVLWGSPE